MTAGNNAARLRSAEGAAMILSDKHLVELRASGLTDETIAAAGLRTAKDSEAAELLGWQPRSHNWGDCLAIPFNGPNGDNGYARVKPDFPRTDSKGKSVKYESPKRKPNHVYFPPGFFGATKTSRIILVVEGEKKSSCWTTSRIPDHWSRRSVRISKETEA